MLHTTARKSVRRVILTFMVLILASLWYTTAAQTDTLTVGSTTGAAGQRQSATISLTNTHKIAGLQLALKIGAKTVMIDTLGATTRTEGMMVQWNAQNGKILMIDFALKHMIAPGGGPILNVKYYVASTAAARTVGLTAEGVVLSNLDGRSVPVVVKNGQFVIESPAAPGRKSN